MCVCTYVCMYVCMCVCIHVYACIHNKSVGIVRGICPTQNGRGIVQGELSRGELSYTLVTDQRYMGYNLCWRSSKSMQCGQMNMTWRERYLNCKTTGLGYQRVKFVRKDMLHRIKAGEEI